MEGIEVWNIYDYENRTKEFKTSTGGSKSKFDEYGRTIWVESHNNEYNIRYNTLADGSLEVFNTDCRDNSESYHLFDKNENVLISRTKFGEAIYEYNENNTLIHYVLKDNSEIIIEKIVTADGNKFTTVIKEKGIIIDTQYIEKDDHGNHIYFKDTAEGRECWDEYEYYDNGNIKSIHNRDNKGKESITHLDEQKNTIYHKGEGLGEYWLENTYDKNNNLIMQEMFRMV